MSGTRVVCSFVTHAWLCDHFGHLNVRHYAAAFDDATFIFWNSIGFRHRDDGPRPVTLEAKTGFKHETLAGTIAQITAEVTKVGQKSVGLRFEMRDGGETVLAICDVVEVFVDPTTRRSCPIPESFRTALASLQHPQV